MHSAVLVYLWRHATGPLGFGPYGWTYAITQPILWAFYFLLTLEFYSLMLEEFPGIRRLGRLVMFGSLGGVTAASLALLFLDQQAGVEHYPLLFFLALQQRTVFLSLSGITLLLLLFVAHYRLGIRRNVWILCACFGGYFLSSAALFTLRDHFGDAFTPLRDLAGALVHFCVLLGASFFLSRAGETEVRPISAMWGSRDRELEAALTVQLRGFNQVLVKVLRQ